MCRIVVIRDHGVLDDQYVYTECPYIGELIFSVGTINDYYCEHPLNAADGWPCGTNNIVGLRKPCPYERK